MKRTKNFQAKTKKSRDTKIRFFVDPASISTGWALFRGRALADHGTIAVDKTLNVFTRLQMIGKVYNEFKLPSFSSVHIEKMPRRVHHFTMWSVGVIGISLKSTTIEVDDDIPVRSWQKCVNWDRIKDDWEKFGCLSQDEWAAINMGKYYLKEKT